jgi:CheY-like chemotaxis protein
MSERGASHRRSGLAAGMPAVFIALVAWTGFAVHDYLSLRGRLARDLTLAADGIVMSVAPLLERADFDGVQTVLGSLAARPDVTTAHLLGRDGRSLVRFVRDGHEATLPALRPAGPPSFEGRRLQIFRDVLDRQRRPQVTLFVETSTEELARRLWSLVGLTGAVGLLALGSLLLARQRRPHALTAVTVPEQDVSEPAFATSGAPAARPAPGVGHFFRSETPVATVLVIDDDDETRELLARGLAREGFHIVTAADCEQGIRRAREVRPDLITLDAQMPEADGWTVLRALKEDEELSNIPVVMTTLVNERSDGQRRTLDYLSKPIDPERLAAILQSRHAAGEASILVVAQDAALRQAAGAILAPRGWMVLEADGPDTALQLLAGALPDVVLFDFDLPRGQLEFVDSLKSHPAWCEIPLVIVSSAELSAEQRVSLEERPLRFFQKSALSSQELARQIRGLLDGERRSAATRRADAS